MPLRYGSRCRPNNLREGAMVPLLRTFLREARQKLRPSEIRAGFFHHSFERNSSGGLAKFAAIRRVYAILQS